MECKQCKTHDSFVQDDNGLYYCDECGAENEMLSFSKRKPDFNQKLYIRNKISYSRLNYFKNSIESICGFIEYPLDDTLISLVKTIEEPNFNSIKSLLEQYYLFYDYKDILKIGYILRSVFGFEPMRFDNNQIIMMYTLYEDLEKKYSVLYPKKNFLDNHFLLDKFISHFGFEVKNKDIFLKKLTKIVETKYNNIFLKLLNH